MGLNSLSARWTSALRKFRHGAKFFSEIFEDRPAGPCTTCGIHARRGRTLEKMHAKALSHRRTMDHPRNARRDRARQQKRAPRARWRRAWRWIMIASRDPARARVPAKRWALAAMQASSCIATLQERFVRTYFIGSPLRRLSSMPLATSRATCAASTSSVLRRRM